MTIPSNHSLQAVTLSCVRQRKLLFTDLSFCVPVGSLLLVTGPNGAGKSSLMRILAGIAAPLRGSIWWQGKLIDAAYKEQLHYVGHTNGIKLGLSVIENLQLINALSGHPTINYASVLASLQLDSQRNELAGNLSAGQKRRIALAKLLLFPKQLWILDEPFTAIDNATQQLFLYHLESHLKNDGIAIISSHHPLSLDMNTQILELSPC